MTLNLISVTIPGMWERTITIGSAGKTFSMTGWKLEWAYGPEHFIKKYCIVHQTAIYTCATTAQEAVARCFEQEINLLDKSDIFKICLLS